MATNTIIGNGFQQANLGSSLRNVIVGYKAGAKMTTNDTDNILIGYDVGKEIRTRLRESIILGSNSLAASTVTDARGEVIIGYSTASALRDGWYNTIIGQQAGINITRGDQNISIGYGAHGGGGTMDNDENIAIGTFAGNSLSTGAYGNDLIGANAGFGITSGDLNIGIGDLVMYNANGSSNIAFGANSLYNVTGSQNVSIGEDSGTSITTGSNNVFIGYEAGSTVGNVSNFLEISSNGNMLLQGDFATRTLTTGGYIQLTATAAPAQPAAGFGRLYVNSGDGGLYYIGSAGTITPIAPA